MEEIIKFDVAVNPKIILQCGAAGVSSFSDDREDEAIFSILKNLQLKVLSKAFFLAFPKEALIF